MLGAGLIACAAVLVSGAELDTFGLEMFLPTKEGSKPWNSAHWGNGKERRIKYASDPDDPTDWTEDHSASSDGFLVDGKGVMQMSGGSPRFHVNSLRSGPRGSQFFLNTEFTAYYRRAGRTGAAYGGLVVGVRSGALGHASSGGDDCDATTYYARFRHDGKWDFEKELKHPGSDWWSGSGYHAQDPLWSGSVLPEHRWIGMKYLVWNLPGGRGVHLESWIDSVSGGVPAKAVWKRVGEVVDSGQWPGAAGAVQGCSYAEATTVILEGHGTMLLRTDGDTAQYKMVSVREIVPPTGSLRAMGRAVGGTRRSVRLEAGPFGKGSGEPPGIVAVSADGRRLPVRVLP